MGNGVNKIVVAGDVTIDWLMWRIDPKKGKDCLNWELYKGTQMAARPGGALLLAETIAKALDGTGVKVIAPRLTKIEDMPPTEVLHSLAMLERFPYSTSQKDEKNLAFRVGEFLGYDGPPSNQGQAIPWKEEERKEGEKPDYAPLVVIDDAGNGFRGNKEAWPQDLVEAQPVVILKRSSPFSHDVLWRHLEKCPKKIVVVSADHLRSVGVNISRRLSWERTAKDLLWQLLTSDKLACLRNLPHVVIQFGLDGAVHFFQEDNQSKARLYYDPVRLEDDFNLEECHGKMAGLTVALVTALARNLVENNLDFGNLGEGIRKGIVASRRWLQRGFGLEKEIKDKGLTLKAQLQYPGAEVFRLWDQEESSLLEEDIPPDCTSDDPDPYFWTILEDKAGACLREQAQEIVEKGINPQVHPFPLARFGKLLTLDRAEMESFRSIKNILGLYLKEPHTHPISLAVFGPPGSGKSFGVTQVAKSIKVEGVKLQTLEFNLSQWSSPQDLITAFHRVRDVVLGGEVPLVFFDEFDSEFQGPLGWLKYFLDPMQSGRFKEGETIHPIGKSIFVFAGGTSWTLKQFSREKLSRRVGANQAPAPDPAGTGLIPIEDDSFIKAKGPDFVSRLKGYVDIFGVNRQSRHDNLFLIRRAVVWRGLFEGLMGKEGYSQLFAEKNKVKIHPGVLWALLMVPQYKHGVRSMEAILKMSDLAKRRQFEQAALPPVVQLELHVDAGTFRRLLHQQVIFEQNREKWAEQVHENYRRIQKEAGRGNGDRAMKSWQELAQDLRESNQKHADQIPEKLIAVGCLFRPAPPGKAPAPFRFTDEEVEFLARIEHARWMSEKLAKGWRYGPDKDENNKTHLCLVPWDQLPDNFRNNDRKLVRALPEILAASRLEIHRLEGY